MTREDKEGKGNIMRLMLEVMLMMNKYALKEEVLDIYYIKRTEYEGRLKNGSEDERARAKRILDKIGRDISNLKSIDEKDWQVFRRRILDGDWVLI